MLAVLQDMLRSHSEKCSLSCEGVRQGWAGHRVSADPSGLTYIVVPVGFILAVVTAVILGQ